MESMEMFNEILRDFKQSDLISMDVEMPGIRLSMKRESAPAGLTAERSVNLSNRSHTASPLDPAENAADGRTAGTGFADDTTSASVLPAAGGALSSAPSTERTDAASDAAGTETENPQNDAAESILCPLVGIFYSASAPDAEPFVTEGQRVKKGEVLCIIEAMKSMNELKAPYDLTVKKVCIKNGDMAEFHQVLFEVEKC